MQFAFPWPATNAEWMAFGVAAFTLLFGLLMLFAPRVIMRLLRLQATQNHPEALAEIRGRMGGPYLGISLCAILLAQPLLYLALGFSWLFTAFGRLVSMMSDDGFRAGNFAWMVLELGLAAIAMGYGLGWLS